MKATLYIPIDTSKPDMGVSDLIEEHRDLFDSPSGREQIAWTMSRLMESRRTITRQMVEKWFNTKDRTLPSSVLFVTLIMACLQIKEDRAAADAKKTTKAA